MKFLIHYKYASNGTTIYRRVTVAEEDMFPQKGLMCIDQITYAGFGLDVDGKYTSGLIDADCWIPPGQVELIEIIRE